MSPRSMAGVMKKRVERHLHVAMACVLMALYVFVNGVPGRPPPPEGCVGRGCHVQLLADTLHSRVKRPLGDKLQLDMTGASWRSWQGDDPGSPCVDYETRFGHDVARVWLVSFPCSGNTWVRYLLESATGVFTGSAYKDKILYEAGMFGEMEAPSSGRTLVQKTHGGAVYGSPQHDLLTRYSLINPHLPTILLLRHPARAIISYWKFYTSRTRNNKHTAQISPSMFGGKGFRQFVAETTLLWEEVTTDRLLWSSGPLYVLHYEHLLQNTTHHLRHLLHFLRVQKDEGRMACVSTHLTGSFKRSGNNSNFDPFTKDEKMRMTSAVKRVNRLLLLLGYPQPPVYEGFLVPTSL
ncbi:WSCD family member AGAP003962-like isoform X2 [Homarus americanus]|uniref:WSCD family member AGAP003962-like isoform X2 n=1 Tax=Homarus americanus TaxID=6706 RepID=UPI001C47D816|nr:WSCD family member AGAP003962-like isoform X2 [Homarus americanus]